MKITESDIKAAKAIMERLEDAEGDFGANIFAELIAREHQAEREAVERLVAVVHRLLIDQAIHEYDETLTPLLTELDQALRVYRETTKETE